MCIYTSYEDNGEALKTLISNYEEFLIDENIINDGSGKSYRQFLIEIASNEEIKKIPSIFLKDQLQFIAPADTQALSECEASVMSDTLAFNNSKFKRLQAAMDKHISSRDLQPALMAQDIVDILDDDDFESDFYKFRVMLLFSIFDMNTGIARKLPPVENTTNDPLDLSKALNISIDSNDEITVNEESVSLQELNTIVRAYETEKKSEAIIAIKPDRGTSYKMYIAVQNVVIGEIQSLREQLAKEKFNMKLEDLSEEQLKEIKRIYPQRITE